MPIPFSRVGWGVGGGRDEAAHKNAMWLVKSKYNSLLNNCALVRSWAAVKNPETKGCVRFLDVAETE